MKAKPLKTLRRKHEGRKYLPNIRFGDSVGEGVIQTWNLGDQQWPSSCCMIRGSGGGEGEKEERREKGGRERWSSEKGQNLSDSLCSKLKYGWA